MTAQNILSIAGLLTGMTGAYIMFYFSPKVDSGTWLYSDKEADKMRKRDGYKNKMVRKGMLLLPDFYCKQGLYFCNWRAK